VLSERGRGSGRQTRRSKWRERERCTRGQVSRRESPERGFILAGVCCAGLLCGRYGRWCVCNVLPLLRHRFPPCGRLLSPRCPSLHYGLPHPPPMHGLGRGGASLRQPPQRVWQVRERNGRCSAVPASHLPHRRLNGRLSYSVANVLDGSTTQHHNTTTPQHHHTTPPPHHHTPLVAACRIFAPEPVG
jgi:hypothetical protein